MDNEKAPTPLVAEETKNTPELKDAKIFNPKDLENKSHDEQINHLDGALSNLDSMSEELNNALAASELERSGKKGVIEQSSVFAKTGLALKNIFGGKEAYDEKLSEMAKKVTEKNLDGLERGLGADVLTMKENIKVHEAASKNDLDAAKELFKPEEFTAMENKMTKEKEVLTNDKDLKEKELQEKIAEYPAEQKFEKITNALGEYGQIESSIKDKRLGLEGDLKKHETAYNKIKGEGEASLEIKQKLKEKIELLNKQSQEMRDREKLVKDRIEVLKSSQKELDPFVKRLRAVGKTKAEIFEENKARMDKSKEPGLNENNGNKTDKNNQKQDKPSAIPEGLGGKKPNPEKAEVEKTKATGSDSETTETETTAATGSEVEEAKNQKSGAEANKNKKNNQNNKKGVTPAPKPKQAAAETPEGSEEQKISIKLQSVIKTPKQWGLELKSSSDGLLKMAGINDIPAIFNKEFRGKTELTGLEAANFLRGLIKKKFRNANEKAREAIRKIII